MEKAYDLKELGERLKAKGIVIAEDAMEVLAEEVFVFLEDSAKASENAYDDMALIILPQLKNLVMDQIDKIDGEES